ncbi:MAG: hypothetical protein AB8B97_24765 [Granulosicoccus sp.]
MSKENRAVEFMKRLSEDREFRLNIGLELLEIEEGDWSKLVKVAKDHGYTFTKTQLLAIMPDTFFKGHGKNPDVGWDESTRKRRKAGKAKKSDKVGKSRKSKAVT